MTTTANPAFIKKGDRITFKSATRSGAPTLTRVVNGKFTHLPTVRAHGLGAFVVRLHEITHINGIPVDATA